MLYFYVLSRISVKKPDQIASSPIYSISLESVGSEDDSDCASTIAASDVNADDNILSGIGLTAGNVIYAVGKAELDAMNWLWLYYRRAVITWNLSREVMRFRRGTEGIFDDLIEFYQWPQYDYPLIWWARNHLLDQMKRGASGHVTLAMHRAPVAIRLDTLSRLSDAAIRYLHPKDLQEYIKLMEPVAKRLLRYFNELQSLDVDGSSCSAWQLASVSAMWGGEEERWLRHKLTPEFLHVDPQFSLCQLAHYQLPRKTALWMLRSSKSLLGIHHPVNISLAYILDKVQERVDDSTVQRRAVDTFLRSYSQRSPSATPSWHAPMNGALRSQLEHQHRWLESEVFWRLMIRAQRTSRVPFPSGSEWYALSELQRILCHQRRKEEADLCTILRDTSWDSLSLRTPVAKPGPLARMKTQSKFGRHRSSTQGAAQSRPIDEWEQLWARWNQLDDEFLRNIAFHLNDIPRGLIMGSLKLDTDREEEDFHTTHECSSGRGHNDDEAEDATSGQKCG